VDSPVPCRKIPVKENGAAIVAEGRNNAGSVAVSAKSTDA
jgi:hypothetical protein